MSLDKLKENATQEEINNWIVKATEEYNLLKTSLETLKTKEEEYKKLTPKRCKGGVVLVPTDFTIKG